jgi:cysteine synthase A
MSEGNSPARALLMRALGAEVVLAPQVDGRPGEVTGRDIGQAETVARDLAATRGAYYVDQFNNPGGQVAHYGTTAAEIIAAIGYPDAFVAAVGTGDTFRGVSRRLREGRHDVVCAVVEPLGAEVLLGGTVSKPQHLLQGTGYGRLPQNWTRDLADLSISVSDEEARDWRARLGALEGLYVGYSSAANVCASARLLERGVLPSGARVATILCDTGLKY